MKTPNTPFDGDEIKSLFTELKGLMEEQQHKQGLKAVTRLEHLYISYIEKRSIYKTEEKEAAMYRVATTMMRVNSMVSTYERAKEYYLILHEFLFKED